MALDINGNVFSPAATQEIAGCYTLVGNSYICHAVEAGFMTVEEWEELMALPDLSADSYKDYHPIRGMFAMFVILAMGEEL